MIGDSTIIIQDDATDCVSAPTPTQGLSLRRTSADLERLGQGDLQTTSTNNRAPIELYSGGILGTLVNGYRSEAQRESHQGQLDTVWGTPGPVYLVADHRAPETDLFTGDPQKTYRLVCLPDHAPSGSADAVLEIGSVKLRIDFGQGHDDPPALRVTFQSVRFARASLNLSTLHALSPIIQNLVSKFPEGFPRLFIVESNDEQGARALNIHRDAIQQAWGADRILLPGDIRDEMLEVPQTIEQQWTEFADNIDSLITEHQIRAKLTDAGWCVSFRTGSGERLELHLPEGARVSASKFADLITMLDQQSEAFPELRRRRIDLEPFIPRMGALGDAFAWAPSLSADPGRRELPIEFVLNDDQENIVLNRMKLGFQVIYPDEPVSKELCVLWLHLLEELGSSPVRLATTTKALESANLAIKKTAKQLVIASASWLAKNPEVVLTSQYVLSLWIGDRNDPRVADLVTTFCKDRPLGVLAIVEQQPEVVDSVGPHKQSHLTALPRPRRIDVPRSDEAWDTITVPTQDSQAVEAEQQRRLVPFRLSPNEGDGPTRYLDAEGKAYVTEELTLPLLRTLVANATNVTPGRDDQVIHHTRRRLLAQIIVGNSDYQIHDGPVLADRKLPYETLIAVEVAIAGNGAMMFALPDTLDLNESRVAQQIKFVQHALEGLTWLRFKSITVAQEVDATAEPQVCANAARRGEILLDGRDLLRELYLAHDVDASLQRASAVPEGANDATNDINYQIGYRLAVRVRELLAQEPTKQFTEMFDKVVAPLTAHVRLDPTDKAVGLSELFEVSAWRERNREAKAQRLADVYSRVGARDESEAGLVAALYRFANEDFARGDAQLRADLRTAFDRLKSFVAGMNMPEKPRRFVRR